MADSGELERIAVAAARYAASDEAVAAVVAAEDGYVCAFSGESRRSWLVLDAGGEPIVARQRVVEIVSLAALRELADEPGNGGDVAASLEAARGAVDGLAREVEARYKLPFRD